MDTAAEHYFVIVGELCENARLARLPVEVRTRDGRWVRGVPYTRPAGPSTSAEELDHTGFAHDLLVGTETVALSSIVEISVASPSPGAAGHTSSG